MSFAARFIVFCFLFFSPRLTLCSCGRYLTICVCVCVCRVCAVLLVRCCDASRLHLAQFASGHVLLRSAPHHIIVLSLLLLLCLPCSARSQRLNTRRMPRKQSGISASFEYDHSHYHCLLPCWFSGDSRGGGQVTRRDNHMPPSC